MAHYFETGFFLRERAWHGLGTVLQNAPTIDEAIRAAELDWPVDTLAAFARDERTGDMIEAPDTRIVVRRRHGYAPEPLGHVGPRFTPLQNRDAFRWFAPLVADGDLELEAAGSLKGGRNVWILGRVRSAQTVSVGARADDIIAPYLLLSNAHDGSRAVTAAFTPIRVVCWNTLSAAHRGADAKGSAAVRIRHTASMDAQLRELRDRIDLERRNFEGKALVWRELFEAPTPRPLQAERYVRELFGTPATVAAAKAKGEELPPVRAERHVAELFRNGPGADSARNTWFGLYMAATHYIDHERGRNADSRLSSAWFGDGAATRDRAEALACELAGVGA